MNCTLSKLNSEGQWCFWGFFSEKEERYSPENISVSSVSLGNQSRIQQSGHHSDCFSVKEITELISYNQIYTLKKNKTFFSGHILQKSHTYSHVIFRHFPCFINLRFIYVHVIFFFLLQMIDLFSRTGQIFPYTYMYFYLSHITQMSHVRLITFPHFQDRMVKCTFTCFHM